MGLKDLDVIGALHKKRRQFTYLRLQDHQALEVCLHIQSPSEYDHELEPKLWLTMLSGFREIQSYSAGFEIGAIARSLCGMATDEVADEIWVLMRELSRISFRIATKRFTSGRPNVSLSNFNIINGWDAYYRGINRVAYFSLSSRAVDWVLNGKPMFSEEPEETWEFVPDLTPEESTATWRSLPRGIVDAISDRVDTAMGDLSEGLSAAQRDVLAAKLREHELKKAAAELGLLKHLVMRK